jgi:hypothetical protein
MHGQGFLLVAPNISLENQSCSLEVISAPLSTYKMNTPQGVKQLMYKWYLHILHLERHKVAMFQFGCRSLNVCQWFYQ